ncbi:hypothetical protein [Helicobacter cynogastricus]|uniref:hypothetical protein n=1 Tax=Helicobacter cynogastricus TaxID=329937 RepID=UPI00131591DE|nr:hypothetical protein [Helicobacter cynogastricus]
MDKLLSIGLALLLLGGCCQCPSNSAAPTKKHKQHKKPPKVAPNDGEPAQVE